MDLNMSASFQLQMRSGRSFRWPGKEKGKKDEAIKDGLRWKSDNFSLSSAPAHDRRTLSGEYVSSCLTSR